MIRQTWQWAIIGFLGGASAALVGSLTVVWLTSRLDYRVTRRHLKVTFFGLCLRRLRLSNIRSVSAHRLERHGWAEHWWNTMRPSHRFLVVRRKSGWPRYFVITPLQRYVFRAELEEAMERLSGARRSNPSDSSTPHETDA